ncbi:hypothetical protein TREMEDRAFT_27045, partial [Tremella mesenterica DSM 1558]|uniref:uncharacterized protein n=1 Tax=Tremella mesenterica (strain ATCC 24925 / CBS 8224 / DSM 1558 / NBRC 9311 / NRRL Y-6157 / RJB 2259-6 / UBC 559-6) TaxID=578456 RepID=UPI0003F4999C
MVTTRESPDVIQTPLDAIEVDLNPVVNEEIFLDDRSESGEQENIDNEQGNDVDRDNSPNTGPQPTERRRGQGIWGGNWVYENDIVENERNDEEGRNDGDEGIVTTRHGQIIRPPHRFAGLTDSFLDFSREPNKLVSLASIAGIESDTSLIDPISPEEAVNGPDGEKWLESMEKEISNIESKDTWVETVLPPGRKAIGCKWVFKVKTDSEGNLLKYKSRLVAQGFSQIPGVDYEETFAPVGRSGSLRILLTIAATEDLEIRQADVEGAYLNGKLDVEIYMKYPKGIKPKPGCNTLKLIKSLYGLKQSGRTWWIELGEGLSHLGFSRIESDWGLYYRPEGKIEGKGAAILLAYVDDLVLARKSKEEAKEIFDGLGKRWIITDLGEISTILGMKVTRNREEKTIWLNQPAYIDKIVQKFPENDLHRDRKTPLPLTAKNPSMSEVESEIRPFQELIGCLQWLATCTRPDISYAASYLARYLTKPTKKVWEEGIMVITYLRSTRLHGIRLGGEASDLAGWVDADWAGCKDTRRSTTGWIFMMNDSPITWSSKRQATVSSSTVEAEYIAMAEAAKEAQWLRGLLREIGYDQLNPTILNCDNQGSISLARKPGTHQRTKHIDIRHHALRDLVSNKVIELEYVSTVYQRADVLTKALGGPVHS